jgi:hypothetical protein
MSTSSQTLCLPVLNTQRSHFHLKTDTKFLLSKTGINPDWLTFRDDLDLHGLHQQGRLTLTLVDHNVLVGGDVALEDSVAMVIDHRPLERRSSDRFVPEISKRWHISHQGLLAKILSWVRVERGEGFKAVMDPYPSSVLEECLHVHAN